MMYRLKLRCKVKVNWGRGWS